MTFFSSLQFRLLLLVLVVLVPLSALIIFTNLEERRLAREQVSENALRLAELLAAEQEDSVEATRQLLAILAENPAVRRGDPQTCSAYMATTRLLYPRYANLGAVRPNGDIFCSAFPFSGQISVASRLWYQRAAETHAFSVGEYATGLISQRPGLAFGYPVFQENGTVASFLFAALDLDWDQLQSLQRRLPAGSTFLMVDPNGTVLVRHPDNEKWVGRSVRDSSQVQLMLSQRRGTAEATGVDGMRRLYAFVPWETSRGETGAYLSIGISRETVYAQPDYILKRNLFWLAVLAMLVLAGSRALAARTILRPVGVLVNATQQLTAGDLSARIHVSNGTDEIARLSQSFNTMAAAVQERQSQRQRAEEARRKSEQRLSLVHSTVADVLFHLQVEAGGQFRFVAVNPAFYQATGLNESQVAGKLVQEVIPEPSLSMVLGKYEEAIRTKDTVHWEETTRYPAGVKHGEISVTPVFDTAGHCTSLVGCVHDITARTRAEEALRESEEKLRLFVEHAPAAIAMLDCNMNYIAASHRWFSDYGVKDSNIIGRSHYEVFPEIPERWKEIHRRCLAGAVERNEADPWVRLDGGTEWVRWEIRPWRKSDDAIGGLIIFSEVITERKQAEEALRLSEGKYRSLLSNIPDVTWTSNAEGDTTFISPNVGKVYGYTPQEIYAGGADNWLGRIHPEDLEKVTKAYEALFREGKAFDAEYRVRRKDGRWIWVHDRAISTYEKEGVRYTDGVFSDITERRTLEMQLIQAQKMEAVGRLAGGVAHDFNNMLGIILGYSELALERLEPTHPLQKDIGKIRDAATRAAALTRQLLAFSRKQIIEPKTLDLNASVSTTSKLLQRLIGEDIELVLSLSPGLGMVEADPSQMDQIIMNLAVNARDAMPQGGRLTIETANVELDESYVQEHPLITPGRFVMLSVSDSGVGMSKEMQLHIYEPFFTTKEPGKGTGLGLATVYGIVKQSNGFIWVYSEPGHGTTFKIYLPRVEAPVHVAAIGQSQLQPRGSETILLVEDEAMLREVARSLLEDLGYEVLEVSNGAAAIELVERYPLPIHLLMTDVVMPGLNGRELAERLQGLRPDLKVLFVSGYTDDVVFRQGLAREGVAFIQKPFTKVGLAGKVREVLSSKE